MNEKILENSYFFQNLSLGQKRAFPSHKPLICASVPAAKPFVTSYPPSKENKQVNIPSTLFILMSLMAPQTQNPITAMSYILIPPW